MHHRLASVCQEFAGQAAADFLTSHSCKQATLQVLLQVLAHGKMVKANKQNLACSWTSSRSPKSQSTQAWRLLIASVGTSWDLILATIHFKPTLEKSDFDMK